MMPDRTVYTFGLHEHFIRRLADVVEKDFLSQGTPLGRLLFVFGGKRPGYFLKAELSRRCGRAFIPPRCCSWNEWVDELTQGIAPRPLITDLDAWFVLYQAARKVAPEIVRGRETFSRFISWAREIASFLDQLDSEQVPDGKVLHIQQAAAIGYDVPESINQLLQHIVKLRGRLNAYLDEHGLDTRGRRLQRAEALLRQKAAGEEGDIIFFCNFFYLHQAEQQLIKAVWESGRGVLVFQGDEREWPVLADTGRKLGVRIQCDPAVPAAVPPIELKLYEGLDTHSQASMVARIIQENPRRRESVIVLPDAATLVPLLSELDVPYEDCNVSMGYPLQRSALFTLLHCLLAAQGSRRGEEYYVKDYVRVMSHPFVKNMRGTDCDASRSRILVHKVEELLRGTIASPLAGSLFVRLADIESSEELYAAAQELLPEAAPCRSGLQAWLAHVHDAVFRRWEEVGSLADACRSAVGLLDELGENSFLEQYPLDVRAGERLYGLFEELSVCACAREPFAAEEVFRIFERRLHGEKLAFSGTPLRGMQILGVFETRALTFEQVIICDANEGVLPDIRIYEPLIPREVMLRLGLNRLEKEEEIQRYHLMRLLRGAQVAHVVYNAAEDKERSRFIEELVWDGQQRTAGLEYGRPVRAGFAVRTLPAKRSIPKTQAMVDFLQTVTYSASSLDVYLRCPLRFYFQYVLGLRQQEELAEDPEAADIGTFVHELLEEAYQPLLGRPLHVTPEFRARVAALSEKKFSAFFSRRMKSGAFLLETILNARREAFLDAEAQREKTHIIGLEQQCSGTLVLDALSLPLTARVDRIERRDDGSILIIDYKTGSHDAKPKGAAALAAMETGDRSAIRSAVISFQLPLYQMLIAQQYPEVEVSAALYLLREARLSFFPAGKTQQERTQIIAACRSAMQAIAAEILDQNIVFSADESEPKYCAMCPFLNMCR